ncbi:hypothetical protein BT96DRAFT_1006014 [Gymnopus androsaceus JB14]|uniref:Uncharacterized protein n=1 Tax=Gymnopus androsaceus JB14 TaxID=1447944 RepID=A0A6A4GL91_9AGAR|nr:hypothetical protein BT96DRAFT_1006014 [Gymnopus androsaceus JB14]
MSPTVTTTKTTAELITEMADALETLRQKEAQEKAQEEAEKREKKEAEQKAEEQRKAKAEVKHQEKEKQEAERKAREKQDKAERKAQVKVKRQGTDQAPEAEAKKKKEIEERRKRLAVAADHRVLAPNSVASTMVDAHPPKKIKKSKEVVNSEDKEKMEPKAKCMAGKRKRDAVGGDPSGSDPDANGSNDDADDDDKPAPKKPKMEVCKCCTVRKEACVLALGSSSVCTRCKQAKVTCSLSGKPKKKGELEAGDLPSELGCLDDWLACLEQQVDLIGQLLQQILLCMPEPEDESGEAMENEKDEEEKKRRVKEGKKRAP